MNTTKQSGGGFINKLSIAKSKMIKTPLNLHREWNEKVNNAKSIKELNNLK